MKKLVAPCRQKHSRTARCFAITLNYILLSIIRVKGFVPECSLCNRKLLLRNTKRISIHDIQGKNKYNRRNIPEYCNLPNHERNIISNLVSSVSSISSSKEVYSYSAETIPEKISELLSLIEVSKANGKNPETEKQISNIIQELEALYKEEPEYNNGFEQAFGLYNVTYIQKQSGNISISSSPAGGKWTKQGSLTQFLFTTNHLYQHILPPLSSSSSLAQAVNIVGLKAFNGLFQIWILLRGNVVEYSSSQEDTKDLTKLAIKANFDAPKIVFDAFSKRLKQCLCFSLGPSSSVILDTTFVNERIRIGKGGFSGTRFVFSRLSPDNDKNAGVVYDLLKLKPLSRLQLWLGTSFGFGIAGFILNLLLIRNSRLSIMLSSIMSFMFGGLLLSSTGGIERDDASVQLAKESND